MPQFLYVCDLEKITAGAKRPEESDFQKSRPPKNSPGGRVR
jgi:hypothetical protein